MVIRLFGSPTLLIATFDQIGHKIQQRNDKKTGQGYDCKNPIAERFNSIL